MSKGIVYVSHYGADQLQKHLHQCLLRDISGYKAERWSEVTEHPTETKYFIRWKQKIDKYLTDAQKGKIEEIGEDWFPEQEEI